MGDMAEAGRQLGQWGLWGYGWGAERGVRAGCGEFVKGQGHECGWSCCTGPRADKRAAAQPGSPGRGGNRGRWYLEVGALACLMAPGEVISLRCPMWELWEHYHPLCRRTGSQGGLCSMTHGTILYPLAPTLPLAPEEGQEE